MTKVFSNEVKEFAEIQHLGCTVNHTDGCFWFYGESGRYYDYEKAEKQLSEFKKIGITFEQLKQYWLMLFPSHIEWLADKWKV